MITGFWRRQRLSAMLLLHVGLNVLFPVITMSVVSYATSAPQLWQFAVLTIAPWTAIASAAIAWTWWRNGQAGRYPHPPSFAANVIPSLLSWTLVFASVSLAVGSIRSGGFSPVAALDGGISAFMAALMSGLAITKEAARAQKSGDY